MDPFLGQIQVYGFNFPPRNWAYCNGQLLAISQSTALFALFGTTYGGNGQTTFGLPNLQGRTMVHPSSSITLGQTGGQLSASLSVATMPAHTHNLAVAVSTGEGEEPGAVNYIASRENGFAAAPTAGAVLGGVGPLQPTGQALPFSTVEPYLGINICVALAGIFPSRN